MVTRGLSRKRPARTRLRVLLFGADADPFGARWVARLLLGSEASLEFIRPLSLHHRTGGRGAADSPLGYGHICLWSGGVYTVGWRWRSLQLRTAGRPSLCSTDLSHLQPSASSGRSGAEFINMQESTERLAGSTTAGHVPIWDPCWKRSGARSH